MITEIKTVATRRHWPTNLNVTTPMVGISTPHFSPFTHSKKPRWSIRSCGDTLPNCSLPKYNRDCWLCEDEAHRLWRRAHKYKKMQVTIVNLLAMKASKTTASCEASACTIANVTAKMTTLSVKSKTHDKEKP